MKRYLYKTFVVAIACYILQACTARVDVNTKAGKEHLVIYGYVTDEYVPQMISITRSAGYFSTDAPQGIPHAEVTVTTSDNEVVHLYEEAGSGFYVTEQPMLGIPGKTYTLNVRLDFNEDGEWEEYTATSYLPYPARVDSIQLQESELMDDWVEVLLYGKISDNEENYFILQFSKNDTAVNDTLSRFMLMDDEYLIQKEIEGVPVYYWDQEDVEEKLYEGDEVALTIKTITKEYHTFLGDAQQEVSGKIPIFSGPPANVKTNIVQTTGESVPIVGFFAAYSADTKSVKAKQDYAR